MEKLLFSEKQRFNQWWMYLLFLLCNIPIVNFIIDLFTLKLDSETILTYIVSIVVIMILDLFLFFAHLKTEIYETYILVSFFPFIRNKKIYFSDLESYEVRKYRPIIEYGGWGLRYSLSGKGKAYNMSGNMGMQLAYNSGEKLLIGTRKSEELEQVLSKLN